MKTSEFLYGKRTEELKSMEEGLLDRIKASRELIDILLSVPLADRDMNRIKAVVDANNHCNALLEGTI